MRQVVPRTVLALVVWILVIGAVASLAVAQESPASRVAGGGKWVGIPPASDCMSEPVSLEVVIGNLATPVAAEALTEFPVIVESEAVLPTGPAPSAEDLDKASETFWRAIACANGGDTPRFVGYFSPNGFNWLINALYQAAGRTPGPFSAEELTQIQTSLAPAFSGTPQAVATERLQRVDLIRDARVLPDGRILLIGEGGAMEKSVTYAVFRLVDDEWLVEAYGRIGPMPTATPTE
jgi:hypothetical protein